MLQLCEISPEDAKKIKNKETVLGKKLHIHSVGYAVVGHGITLCVIKGHYLPTTTRYGATKRSPKDEYDPEIGKKYSFRRALINYVKDVRGRG